MAEATVALLTEPLFDYELNGRLWEVVGNAEPAAAPHNCYRCAGDDQWVAVAVTNDAQWACLCAALGRPELAADPRNADGFARHARREELDTLVTRDKPVEEAERALQAAGVPAYRVLDTPELLGDEQLRHRGCFVELDHGEGGTGPVLGIPWRLDPGPNPTYTPAPALGADDDYVYRSLLGLSKSEIAALIEEKVIW